MSGHTGSFVQCTVLLITLLCCQGQVGRDIATSEFLKVEQAEAANCTELFQRIQTWERRHPVLLKVWAAPLASMWLLLFVGYRSYLIWPSQARLPGFAPY